MARESINELSPELSHESSQLNCEMAEQYTLNDTWSLYFHAKDSNKKYSDNTTKLSDISNIFDLWGTLNNIPTPRDMFSEINVKKTVKSTNELPAALSLFRSDSYPTWEHPSNCTGFEWSIRKFKDLSTIDDLWQNIILMAVGENYENSEVLNGVRIVDCTIDNKIMCRIELWFNDKKCKDYFEHKIKEILNIPEYTKLLYRDHLVLKETSKF